MWPATKGFLWPRNILNEETVEAFVELFEKVGFHRCADGNVEQGYEKVAIYARGGIPLHAAKQLRAGIWSSKLGPSYDISHHEPDTVGGREYGEAVVYLSRTYKAQRRASKRIKDFVNTRTV